jgi:hypothetical protein
MKKYRLPIFLFIFLLLFSIIFFFVSYYFYLQQNKVSNWKPSISDFLFYRKQLFLGYGSKSAVLPEEPAGDIGGKYKDGNSVMLRGILIDKNPSKRYFLIQFTHSREIVKVKIPESVKTYNFFFVESKKENFSREDFDPFEVPLGQEVEIVCRSETCEEAAVVISKEYIAE